MKTCEIAMQEPAKTINSSTGAGNLFDVCPPRALGEYLDSTLQYYINMYYYAN